MTQSKIILPLLLLISLNLYSQDLPRVEKDYKALEVLAKGLFYIESLYVDEDKAKRDEMVLRALNGMVRELDPHSMVLPKEAFNQFTSDTKGKFGGVGIIVSHERGQLIVVSAIEGTPAHQAGILTGDEIVSIDNKKVTELKGQDPLALMRGDIGTNLKLAVKRKGLDKLLIFNLKRELIKVKSVRQVSLADGFRYVRISSFQDETALELSTILQTDTASIKGLIIDLRGNPGGLLDKAVEIADLFIESGVIISTVGRDKDKIEREFAKKRGTYSDIPLVLILDNGSASASEVLAGALQDYNRALVVGVQSFGKGSVQTLISLPDGSGLKLTVAKYYTPKNRSIHGVGIEPDIRVKADEFNNLQTVQKLNEIQKKYKLLIDTNHSNIDIQNIPKEMQDDTQFLASYFFIKNWIQRKSTDKKNIGLVPSEYYKKI